MRSLVISERHSKTIVVRMVRIRIIIMSKQIATITTIEILTIVKIAEIAVTIAIAIIIAVIVAIVVKTVIVIFINNYYNQNINKNGFSLRSPARALLAPALALGAAPAARRTSSVPEGEASFRRADWLREARLCRIQYTDIAYIVYSIECIV